MLRNRAQLSSTDFAERFAAVERLAHQSPPDPSAIFALLGILQTDHDEELIGWVETALENIQPTEPQRVGLVREIDRYLTGEASEGVAYWAATLLGKLPAADPETLAALTRLLERREPVAASACAA